MRILTERAGKGQNVASYFAALAGLWFALRRTLGRRSFIFWFSCRYWGQWRAQRILIGPQPLDPFVDRVLIRARAISPRPQSFDDSLQCDNRFALCVPFELFDQPF